MIRGEYDPVIITVIISMLVHNRGLLFLSQIDSLSRDCDSQTALIKQ